MDRVSTEQSFEVPLVLAVREGHVEAAEALLKAKANPNFRAKGFGWGETPLLLGVRLGKTPLVSLLLRYGADPGVRIGPFQARQRISSRANALSYAVTYDRVESAELLLLAGASADTDDLARAISGGQTDIAYLLLAAGVNPRLVSTRGRTAIQEASLLPAEQRKAMMTLIEEYLRSTVD
jgi:ankyrin repeat protein